MENEIATQYKQEYMNGLWDRIRFWFLLRKVRRQKVITLWEANLDKLFFESQHKDKLGYDDSQDRAALIEERRKPTEKQDQLKIAALEDSITDAKTIKGQYYKNEMFIADIKSYIKMLDQWTNSETQSES